MYQALMIVHVLIALAIVGLVMLQQGRGADAGAGFGGASNSVFGARGASSFLSRSTAILATVFFATSLSLAYLASKPDNKTQDIMDVSETLEPGKRDLPPIAVEPPAAVKDDIPATNPPAQPGGNK
ncbi:MAG: preprotein translocase subunit SecG [Methylococcaceae bacterium]|jgi:preprotein translocase subunit SecG|nr:preprotein translocase subunit SecG [Methylococcaceae bacterium]